MDCNNYSYSPHMLDDLPQRFTPCNRITIERRRANGSDYYIIFDDTNGGSNKAHDITSAIKTAKEWLKEGV